MGTCKNCFKCGKLGTMYISKLIFIVQSFWWANVVLKLFIFKKKTTFEYPKHNFMENCPFMGYDITNGTRSLFKNQTILQKCADQLISWQSLYIHQTCRVHGIQDDFNCDKCQYSYECFYWCGSQTYSNWDITEQNATPHTSLFFQPERENSL